LGLKFVICFGLIAAAPKITSDLSIRDMTVLAGEEFTISVPFTASPKPHMSWLVDGADVVADERVKFDIPAPGVCAVLHNAKAARTDSGKYTITLTNNHGSDSASCKVTVVGKKNEILKYILMYRSL
jgi:hypothetical protein